MIETYLINFLETKQETMFPEVKHLETGFDYTDDHEFSVWATPEEQKMPDAGGCSSKPMIQEGTVCVVHPVGKDTKEVARRDVAAVAGKVVTALLVDDTLGGALIKGEIVSNDSGEDTVNGNTVKMNVIRFRGYYWS